MIEMSQSLVFVFCECPKPLKLFKIRNVKFFKIQKFIFTNFCKIFLIIKIIIFRAVPTPLKTPLFYIKIEQT